MKSPKASVSSSEEGKSVQENPSLFEEEEERSPKPGGPGPPKPAYTGFVSSLSLLKRPGAGGAGADWKKPKLRPIRDESVEICSDLEIVQDEIENSSSIRTTTAPQECDDLMKNDDSPMKKTETLERKTGEHSAKTDSGAKAGAGAKAKVEATSSSGTRKDSKSRTKKDAKPRTSIGSSIKESLAQSVERSRQVEKQTCPVCQTSVPERYLNIHLDKCLR